MSHTVSGIKTGQQIILDKKTKKPSTTIISFVELCHRNIVSGLFSLFQFSVTANYTHQITRQLHQFAVSVGVVYSAVTWICQPICSIFVKRSVAVWVGGISGIHHGTMGQWGRDYFRCIQSGVLFDLRSKWSFPAIFADGRVSQIELGLVGLR